MLHICVAVGLCACVCDDRICMWPFYIFETSILVRWMCEKCIATNMMLISFEIIIKCCFLHSYFSLWILLLLPSLSLSLSLVLTIFYFAVVFFLVFCSNRGDYSFLFRVKLSKRKLCCARSTGGEWERGWDGDSEFQCFQCSQFTLSHSHSQSRRTHMHTFSQWRHG